MLKDARVSFATAKRSILLFGGINCIVYIILLLAFKYLGLLHIWGLRLVNFLVLALISIYQVHSWIKKNGGYVPFLQAFFTVLFTGALSFVLFGAFIFIYSMYDPYVTQMYVASSSKGDSPLIPAIIILFEGGGGSLIVALIASFYAARFEDGELSN